MKQLFSERLKSARLLNGLSLQDLADRLSNVVSRQALHRYEKGEVLPDSTMIRELSKVLNVQPDFFFRERNVALDKIEFRKLKKLPGKIEEQIIETVKDKLARYLEIEEILSLQPVFHNPLKDMQPIGSLTDIETAATSLRAAWKLGISCIFNCIELLEDNHIKVVEVDTDDFYDGMQTRVNDTIPVITINNGLIKTTDRKRFTALHELAHLLLPLGGLPEKTKEQYCHQFAAAMLLPAEVAIWELGKSRTKILVPELGVLKKQYGISMQAIMMRAKDLGIISDNYCRQFFFMMKQEDWRINEPFHYIGEEKSTRFEQLVYRALAEGLISYSKAAALNNQSVAELKKKISVNI